MTPEQFIREHTRLIKVLKSGSKKAQAKEAADQAKELKAFFKKLRK